MECLGNESEKHLADMPTPKIRSSWGGQSITTLHHRWLLVLSRNLVTFPRNSEMDPNIPIVVCRKEIMNGFCGPPFGFSNTLPETNIAPENGWFGMAYL